MGAARISEGEGRPTPRVSMAISPRVERGWVNPERDDIDVFTIRNFKFPQEKQKFHSAIAPNGEPSVAGLLGSHAGRGGSVSVPRRGRMHAPGKIKPQNQGLLYSFILGDPPAHHDERECVWQSYPRLGGGWPPGATGCVGPPVKPSLIDVL